MANLIFSGSVRPELREIGPQFICGCPQIGFTTAVGIGCAGFLHLQAFSDVLLSEIGWDCLFDISHELVIVSAYGLALVQGQRIQRRNMP